MLLLSKLSMWGKRPIHFPSFEGLDEGEQLKAKALLMKYHSLFAKTDLDVGCTNLIRLIWTLGVLI